MNASLQTLIYAASQLAWPAADNDAALSALKQYGYTGVELVPAKAFQSWPEVTDAHVHAVKQRCDAHDLRAVSMQALFFGVAGLHVFQGDVERNNLLEHILRCAKIADNLNAKTLVFGAPKLRDPADIDAAQANAQAIAFFHQLGERLAQHSNAIVTIEPVAPHHGGTFLTTHAQTAAFVRSVNHPRIRLQFDLGCWIAQQENIEQLAGYVPVIAHSHISAPDLGRIDPSIAATARACYAVIHKAGYKGAISVEMLESKLGAHWLDAIEAAQFSKTLGSNHP